jgi:hypothetical protein
MRIFAFERKGEKMKRMIMIVMAFVAITFFFTDDLLTTVTGHQQNEVYALGGWGPNSDPRPDEPFPRPDGERRRRVNEPSPLALIGTGVVGIGAYMLLRERSKKK